VNPAGRTGLTKQAPPESLGGSGSHAGSAGLVLRLMSNEGRGRLDGLLSITRSSNNQPMRLICAAALLLAMTSTGCAVPPGAVSMDLATDPPLSANTGCPLALAGGTLVRDHRSGFALRNGDQVETVSWPYGYSMVEVDGTAVLLDANGREVAREGDIVQATGGGGMPFHACMDVHRVQGH